MLRMRVERGERGIEPVGVEVVEQQPHAHAPLGRLPERLEQQVADLVAMPDVVLRVERLFRGSASRTRAANASRGSGSAWMPVLPGFAAMPGATARPSLVPAVSVRADGLDAILGRRQRGTAGNDQRKRNKKRRQNAIHLHRIFDGRVRHGPTDASCNVRLCLCIAPSHCTGLEQSCRCPPVNSWEAKWSGLPLWKGPDASF